MLTVVKGVPALKGDSSLALRTQTDRGEGEYTGSIHGWLFTMMDEPGWYANDLHIWPN